MMQIVRFFCKCRGYNANCEAKLDAVNARNLTPLNNLERPNLKVESSSIPLQKQEIDVPRWVGWKKKMYLLAIWINRLVIPSHHEFARGWLLSHLEVCDASLCSKLSVR
jgi:hypothetical protein